MAHVPNVLVFDGLLDLFSLCNLMEFSNIVHPNTYSVHKLDPAEAWDMVETRKKSRAIIAWVFNNYELDGQNTIQDVFWQYMVHQARVLCNGKEWSEKNAVYSSMGEAFSDQVRPLVERTFHNVKEFWVRWNEHSDSEKDENSRSLSFAFPGTETPSVRARSQPINGNASLPYFLFLSIN